MRLNESRLVTSDEMQRVDKETQEVYGIPGSLLMENAGQKAWAVALEEVRRRLPDKRPEITFVAGSGNNGGDALVMARQCIVQDVADVTVITLREQLSGAVGRQWAMLRHLAPSRVVWETSPDVCEEVLERADVIVEGITGTGLNVPLRDELFPLIRAINAADGLRIAVDVPSGMRDEGGVEELTVRADITISTGHRKRFLFAPARRSSAGTIRWVDPGFPDIARATTRLITEAEITGTRPLLQELSPDSHKGIRGRLLVVAGGPGTEGAALLTAEAASTTGAGMVRTVTTELGRQAGLIRAPGLMWRSGEFQDADIEWADGVVVGPGWTEGTAEQLAHIIEGADRKGIPVVMDAAAIRLIGDVAARWTEEGRTLYRSYVVVTPHPGELAYLTGDTVDEVLGRPYRILDEAARRVSSIEQTAILMKGSSTIFRNVDGSFVVLDGRCPALGVAGSGDVLSGILGARLAAAWAAEKRGPSEFTVAVLASLREHLRRGRYLARDGSVFSADILAGTSLANVNSTEA